MTQISAKQAAQIIGISKTAVIKALNNNEITGNKDDKGNWKVDPVDATRYRDERKHKTKTMQSVVDELSSNVSSSLQHQLDMALEREKALLQRVSDQAETIDYERKSHERTKALLEGSLNNLPKMIADQTAENERKKSWLQKLLS